jgi:RHS repeat-associated protein
MNIRNMFRFSKLAYTWAGSFVVAASLQFATGAVGVLMPATAMSSGGQCKWEGGSGTSESCLNEDCLEDGGRAICTKPEIRPSAPGGDATSDGNKFSYGMCDVAGPSIPFIAAWCHAQDGNWVAEGSTLRCDNLSPEYPGIGQAANESAALRAGGKFLSYEDCPKQVTFDSGWGLTDTSDPWCYSGGPVYSNGELVSDMRKQILETPPQCGSSQTTIKYSKSRMVVCPNKYASRTAPDGTLHCFVPAHECCGIKNPVNVVTGAKTHAEVDYRAADGLQFGRYYNSLSRFRAKSPGTFIAGADDYWRFSYSRRVIPAASNPHVIAYVMSDDGVVTPYDINGAEVFNVRGAGGHLVSLGGGGWTLTKANEDVETYDSAGNLTSIATRAGVTTTLTYSAGSLSSISNSFGRTLIVGYDSVGRLSSLDLPDGGQITYQYDDSDRLIGVTNADGTTRTYQYENKNQWLLTGITDEDSSRFATYTYDSDDLVTSEEHAGGVERTTFNIGDPKQSSFYTYYTDAFGRRRSYLITRTAGVFKLQASSDYSPDTPNPGNGSFDANGNPAWSSDRDNRTTNYVYDLARNLETSRTEGLAYGGYATPATRTITTQWHSTLRLPMQVDVYTGATPTGTPLTRTVYTRDAVGNVLTRTVSDVAAGTSRTWAYTYDAFGRVLTEDGPRTDVTDVTTYVYNNCSTGNGCGQLASVTNALNQTTSFDSYDANGQVTQFTASNGLISTLAYDARQRLTHRCVGGALPACSGGELTALEYWPTGLLEKVTQPDGSFLLYTYDPAHRLTQIEDGTGNRLAYVLDAMGNRTSENAFDQYGTLLRSRQTLYNDLGQLWQQLTVARTDSQATVFNYDQSGDQTSVVGPMYRATTSTYDALRRVVQIVDPAFGSTLFSYDANDNLTTVTDPRGRATTYAYSGLGDLEAQVSPDTGTTTSTFDSGGNVHTSTDARGAITTSTYDALGRMSTQSFTLSGSTDQSISYGYDADSNGKGRMTSAADANHSLTWTYDAQGRVTAKTQTVGGVSLSTAYGYSNGVLTTMTTPSGRSLVYGYTGGRLTSISLDGNTLLSNVTYDPFGPVTGWTWGNGTLAVRVFDLDGRLSLLDSAGLSVYTYHDDGTIASRSDDTVNSFTAPAGSSTLTISPTSNRVTSIDGTVARSYSYDAAGNTLSNGSTVHTYYYSGRMKTGRLASSATDTTYIYNALGQRVRKSGGPAGTVLYYYDEGGHLLGEYTSTGALIEETIWFGDIPVATVRTGPGGVEVYYVHTDHLNSPRRVSRPADNVIVWRWDSDAYGEAAPKEDPDGDSVVFAYQLRFPGQYFDPETGLHYNYFRDYDPAVGRYAKSDPIGLKGGINTYAYVGSNPLSYSDPTGLAPPRSQPGTGFPPLFPPGPFDDDWNRARNNAGNAIEDWISRAASAIKEWCTSDEEKRCKKAKEECIAECMPNLGKPGTAYTDCIAKCMDRKGCSQYNPKWKT